VNERSRPAGGIAEQRGGGHPAPLKAIRIQGCGGPAQCQSNQPAAAHPGGRRAAHMGNAELFDCARATQVRMRAARPESVAERPPVRDVANAGGRIRGGRPAARSQFAAGLSRPERRNGRKSRSD